VTNATLDAWNKADEKEALAAMLACCGAREWALAMVALRPIGNVFELSEAADRVWATMNEADWMEAFACHPRIGERKTAKGTSKPEAWSGEEQSSIAIAESKVLTELAEENAQYEAKFGFTYIVCATGKTADEMLALLKRRLVNARATELREAAEQQRQITQIRLGKWLVE
jgi:2-oxo-4-hydroxy-4-carboxy-5-ureidoimidazoline decarboxylase